MIGRFFRAIAIIFSPETLETVPPPDKEEKRGFFFSWLLKPEKLPSPAVSVPPRTESVWRWLLLPEKLAAPDVNEKKSGSPSLLTYLFSSETLPSDPTGPGKGERSSDHKA